jgi:hypothetical protein
MDRALHIRNFFRALVDKQAHEVYLGGVRSDRRGDVLEHGRLAGLRRGDDQAALALPYRRHEVDDARGDELRAVFEAEAHVGVDRREIGELGTAPVGLGVVAIDRVRALQRRVLLVVLGWADLTAHVVATAQLVPAHGRHRDIDVRVTRQVAGGAQEAVALGEDVEDALHLYETLSTDLGLEDGVDELVLLLEVLDVDPELDCLLFELRDLQGFEVLALDRRRRLLESAAAAASLAGSCTHEFLTFSQSARNDSSPRSVSGCLTRFPRTLNGTVAMSAPIRAACVT